jgi:Lon protease-like protein
MPGSQTEFPLFPLDLVVLPTEIVPLHIFEERYKVMINLCLEQDGEFGVIWMADDGLHEIGCACRIDRVIERHEDGQIDIATHGTRPLRVLERQSHLPFPAGVVEFLDDAAETPNVALIDGARSAYTALVERATEQSPDQEQLTQMGAYALAATVDFGLGAKQGLLDLRSENDRLELVTKLFRAAMKRLDFVDRAQARAKSNGKVRFG